MHNNIHINVRGGQLGKIKIACPPLASGIGKENCLPADSYTSTTSLLQWASFFAIPFFLRVKDLIGPCTCIKTSLVLHQNLPTKRQYFSIYYKTN